MKTDATPASEIGTTLPPDLAAEAAALLSESDPADALAPGAEPEPADDAQLDTAAMLASLLQITFNNVIAPRRGDHWKMSADECASLGQVYGAVFDKYVPDFGTGPEVAAALVTVAILGPRIATDVANAKDADQDNIQQADNDAAEGAVTAAKSDESFGFQSSES